MSCLTSGRFSFVLVLVWSFGADQPGDRAGPGQRAGALVTVQHLSSVPCDPSDAPAHAVVASLPLSPFHLAIVDTGLLLLGDLGTTQWEMLPRHDSAPCCKGKTGKATGFAPGFSRCFSPGAQGGETSLGQSPLVCPPLSAVRHGVQALGLP